MEAVFACKQISKDGSASDEFLINEEFITTLDYYVVTSLSAKLSEAESFTLIATGGNIQGPPRTAKEEKLEAGAS